MELKTIDKGLTVSPQIAAADVAKIKKEGFRSIICNRPDGEGADQPNHDEIAAAAKAEGIEMAYLPIVAGKVGDDDADAFGKLMSDLPGPVKIPRQVRRVGCASVPSASTSPVPPHCWARCPPYRQTHRCS